MFQHVAFRMKTGILPRLHHEALMWKLLRCWGNRVHIAAMKWVIWHFRSVYICDLGFRIFPWRWGWSRSKTS
jgi:hypothetical protein